MKRRSPPGIYMQPLNTNKEELEDETIKTSAPNLDGGIAPDSLESINSTEKEKSFVHVDQETGDLELNITDFAPGLVSGGTHQEILIAEIYKSAYQNRIINEKSKEFISDLAANISKDKLNSPIIVRRKLQTINNITYKFELIAGEHRLEAFKENKAERIPAIIKEEMDDIAAAKATILDNVFRKENSAYELFVGYRQLLEMKAFPSEAQLAKEVGISKAEMSRIMCFSKLPEGALNIIEKDPFMVGSNTVYALKDFSESHPNLVLEALQKILDKKILQQKAVSWIKSVITPKAQATIKTITDTKGNSIFTVKVDKSGAVISSSGMNIDSEFGDRLFQWLEIEARKFDVE